MAAPQFQYGPISQGLYMAFIAVLPISFILGLEVFLIHLGLVAFFGLGFRIVLERSGVVRRLESLGVGFIGRIEKRSLEKHHQKIDRQVRDSKYRGNRKKHDDLPPNW